MEIQWSLVLFTLLGGLGAGLLVFTTLFALLGKPAAKRRTYTIIALVLGILGGIFSVLHLASPGNVMAAAQNLGSFSGISLEMIFLALTGVFGIIYLFVAKGEKAGVAEKIVAVLALLSALVFCYVTGSGYVIEARAAWNTPMLPMAYFASDIAMGATLYAFLEGKAEVAGIVKTIVMVAAVLGALGILLYVCAAGLFSGAITWAVVAVLFAVLGAVFAVLYWRAKDGAAKWALAACVCFVLAALALRCGMWVAGVGVMDVFAADYPGNYVFD